MTKAPVTDAQMIEIGEAVDNGMSATLAAKHFGWSSWTIYKAMRHYEKVTGKKLITSPQSKARTGKAAKRKAAAANRKASKANGNGTALATLGEPWQARALEAERRSDELKDQLELATDEVHTLQKIIITLGRAL